MAPSIVPPATATVPPAVAAASMFPPGSAFDDRTVTLSGSAETLADLCGVLGSPTRLAVLGVLLRSQDPLHIHEVARRVKVDASPVRTHLEVLVRAGLAREVKATSGRERRFTTDLTDARLVLQGAHRRREDRAAREPTKAEARVLKKIAALAKKREKLDREAAKLRAELTRVGA